MGSRPKNRQLFKNTGCAREDAWGKSGRRRHEFLTGGRPEAPAALRSHEEATAHVFLGLVKDWVPADLEEHHSQQPRGGATQVSPGKGVVVSAHREAVLGL